MWDRNPRFIADIAGIPITRPVQRKRRADLKLAEFRKELMLSENAHESIQDEVRFLLLEVIADLGGPTTAP